MVPCFWGCKGEDGGREEHGFIVGVRDEEADAFAAEGGEGGARELGGVEPCCC